jgi:hypothetical protein
MGPAGTPAPSGGISGQLKNICKASFDFSGTVVYIAGRGFTALTGAAGSFQFDNVPAGTYDVLAERNGVVIARALQQVVGTSVVSIGELSYPNLNTDAGNCGACNVACTAGQICASGVCAAPNGCPGDGSCSNNGTCTNGACVCLNGYTGADCSIAPPPVCPAGQTTCGSTCVSLSTDPNNCGGCNQACAAGFMCANGACAPNGPTCTDRIRNGAETDVDCGGGTCGGCGVNQACLVTSDCAFPGGCDVVTKTCDANQCNDGVKDSAETDVDCGGGTCGACAVGKSCLVTSDCIAPGGCDKTTHRCDPNQCNDGQKDGTETDIDCGGGTCGACAVSQKCVTNNDCSSGACNLGVSPHVCVPTTCGDAQKDANETDVDCGGSVAICATRCAVSQKCQVNSDCSSGACNFAASPHVCVATTCSDAQKDGNETDVDCGGGAPCGACTVNKQCLQNNDCVTGACNIGVSPHVCVASTCNDGQKDNTESDVDCGGSVCGATCAAGKICNANPDCATGFCNFNVGPHVCITNHCADGQQDSTESDVDCGGSCGGTCGVNQHCNSNFDCNGLVCIAGPTGKTCQ